LIISFRVNNDPSLQEKLLEQANQNEISNTTSTPVNTTPTATQPTTAPVVQPAPAAQPTSANPVAVPVPVVVPTASVSVATPEAQASTTQQPTTTEVQP
jgi:hypothetical protein